MKALVLKACVFLILIWLVLSDSVSLADNMYLPPQEELLTGIEFARIHDKGDYNSVPFFLDSNFDIRRYFYRKGIHPPGAVDLVWEQEAAYVFTPDNDTEVANNFLIKYGFLPVSSRWQPYFVGGAGTVFLTEHIHGQATQFNFNEYAGLGVQYFIKPQIALSVEYRFRHLSNADIKEPNDGVDSNFFLLGISFKF